MFLYLLETLEGAPLSHGGLEKLQVGRHCSRGQSALRAVLTHNIASRGYENHIWRLGRYKTK